MVILVEPSICTMELLCTWPSFVLYTHESVEQLSKWEPCQWKSHKRGTFCNAQLINIYSRAIVQMQSVDLETKQLSRSFSKKTNKRICFSILTTVQDRKKNRSFVFWENLWLDHLVSRSTDLLKVARCYPVTSWVNSVPPREGYFLSP